MAQWIECWPANQNIDSHFLIPELTHPPSQEQNVRQEELCSGEDVYFISELLFHFWTKQAKMELCSIFLNLIVFKQHNYLKNPVRSPPLGSGIP